MYPSSSVSLVGFMRRHSPAANRARRPTPPCSPLSQSSHDCVRIDIGLRRGGKRLIRGGFGPIPHSYPDKFPTACPLAAPESSAPGSSYRGPFGSPSTRSRDDVALNLGGAAGDGFGEGIQVIVAPAVHADDLGRVDTVEIDGGGGDALAELREAQAHDRAAGIGHGVLAVEREAISRGADRGAFGAQPREPHAHVRPIGRAGCEQFLDLESQSDQQRQRGGTALEAQGRHGRRPAVVHSAHHVRQRHAHASRRRPRSTFAGPPWCESAAR